MTEDEESKRLYYKHKLKSALKRLEFYKEKIKYYSDKLEEE